MAPENELLIDKKKSIKIKSKVFEIGKLSLKQMIRFTSVIIQVCVSSVAELKKLDKDVYNKQAESNKRAWGDQWDITSMNYLMRNYDL